MSNNIDDAKLDSLLESFQTAIATYRAELKANGLPPMSSESSRPQDDINYVLPHKMFEAKRIVLASMGSILNSIQTPFDKVFDGVMSATQVAALQIVVRLGIPDLLAKNDATGMTIAEIAKTVDINEYKISASMQMLATLGWFIESSGARYKNNRFSDFLKEGTHGANWSLASEVWDRCFAFQAEAATRPDWRHSTSPLHCGTQLGHRTDKHFFDKLLEDPPTAKCFIDSINALDNSVLGGIVADYPWDSIPSGTTMVDVGGGAGALCLSVGKKYSHLNFLLQDQKVVVDQASANFSQNMKEDPKLDGRFSAQVQNFFEPQPEGLGGDSYSYMFKWIMHDWPESECIKILSHVAKAAGPNSRVLVFEYLVQPTEISTSKTSAAEALAAIDDSAPYKPITDIAHTPKNMGKASSTPSFVSFGMNSLFNASERPVKFYESIFDRAGLELVKVYPLRTWVWAMEARKKV